MFEIKIIPGNLRCEFTWATVCSCFLSSSHAALSTTYKCRESRIEVARGWREGGMGLVFNGYRAASWEEKVMETESGDNCTTV